MITPIALAADMTGHLDFGTASVAALMGYLFVFLGIVLLMAVIIVTGKIMSAKKAAPAEAPKTAEPQKAVEKKKAPGSAGELKLYDTDPRTAAMIMAIVADKMGKPINELHFKSIKEVK